MPTLTYRIAQPTDSDLLGELSFQLIRDEGHRNSMSPPELAARMRDWLAGEYEAVLFELEGRLVAYALFCTRPGEIYLRQLFVARGHRRSGIGRSAVDLLRREIWPDGKRLVVDVLSQNHAATTFWRAVRFSDYALTLESLPRPPADRDANPRH